MPDDSDDTPRPASVGKRPYYRPTTADQTIEGFKADTQKPEPSSVNGEVVRV